MHHDCTPRWPVTWHQLYRVPVLRHLALKSCCILLDCWNLDWYNTSNEYWRDTEKLTAGSKYPIRLTAWELSVRSLFVLCSVRGSWVCLLPQACQAWLCPAPNICSTPTAAVWPWPQPPKPRLRADEGPRVHFGGAWGTGLLFVCVVQILKRQ